MEPTPAETRKQRPAPKVKGSWVVAATLSLFLIVPTVTYVVWSLVSSQFVQHTPETEGAVGSLHWAERRDWPRNQFTLFKSLERGMMSSARTNETYRDFGFHVGPDTQHDLLQAAALARDEAAFPSDAVRLQLEKLAERQPAAFYPRYLLGLWHQENDEPTEADRYFAEAFELAPAALIRRYTTGDGSGDPAADRTVPTIAIGADQVIDDELDRSVVLVYPYLRTDAEGFVYLPVFKSILRQADPQAPPGFAPVDAKPRWFTFYGNVGRLSDAALPQVSAAP